MKNYFSARERKCQYLISYIIIDGIILINALCKNNILKLLNPTIRELKVSRLKKHNKNFIAGLIFSEIRNTHLYLFSSFTFFNCIRNRWSIT